MRIERPAAPDERRASGVEVAPLRRFVDAEMHVTREPRDERARQLREILEQVEQVVDAQRQRVDRRLAYARAPVRLLVEGVEQSHDLARFARDRTARQLEPGAPSKRTCNAVGTSPARSSVAPGMNERSSSRLTIAAISSAPASLRTGKVLRSNARSTNPTRFW